MKNTGTSTALAAVAQNLTSSADKSSKGVEKLEQHLESLGLWRFNELNGATYHQADGDRDWICYDKRMNRSIRRSLKKNFGWTVSSDYLDDIVLSDFSEPFNPIRVYFEDLPEYSGAFNDPISQLASCLTTNIGAKFEEYLRKWLVASVANVFDESKCTNHQCLTLIGEQGDGKSTFLEKLNPPNIAAYCYAGGIKFDNEVDNSIKLSQNFIIHIEETLGDLMMKNDNLIKEFITRPRCNYVRKYANEQKLWPRMANICASLNTSEFLTDITGDRRYLIFRILNIDIEALSKININELWAQAYYLYQSGMRYWFDTKENEAIERNNEQFRVVSEEQEMLTKLFNLHLVEDATKAASHRYTATDLANILKKESPNYRISKLSVGKALRRMGCNNVQEGATGTRYYYLTPISTNGAVENLNPRASAAVHEKQMAAMKADNQQRVSENAQQQVDELKSNQKIKPNDNFYESN